MRRLGFTGDIWPDDIQELLLQAALVPGDRGLVAWYAVRPRIDIDHLPGELHRLMPLLSKALTARGLEDPDLPRLKGVHQFSWYRNTMLFSDASRLVRQLEGVGIPTMLLRGAAIAVGQGRDMGLRAMNDLDLLVPRPDFDRARRVAATTGWSALDEERPIEQKLGTAALRNADGRFVRLHWQPSPHLSLPDALWDDLWARAVPARIDGIETRAPSAADQLVHACVDGARADSGSSLRWVTDSMALLSAADVDWDQVVAEARRLRVSLVLSEALRYLQEALEADIPEPARHALGAIPTTARDRMAHRLSLTTTPRVAPAAEILGRLTRVTAHLSVPQAMAAAPLMLAAVFDVERRRDLPVTAAKKVARAVVSPNPPRARLSQADQAGNKPGHDDGKGPDGSRLSPL